MFDRFIPALRREREAEAPARRGDVWELFDEMMRAPWAGLPLEHRTGPALDVSETDAAVVVRAELPGLSAKDVDLSLDGRALTISGEKREVKNEEQEHRVLRERRYGAFRRSVALPCPVREDKVKAEFKHGVLTVTLPKDEKAKPRRIEIGG
jgi:HSP20 family protein